MIPLILGPNQMPFGGTTLLIMVGVGLQTVKEVNSQLQQHHYHLRHLHQKHQYIENHHRHQGDSNTSN